MSERLVEQKSELGEVIDRIDKTNVTVYEKLNASNDKAAKAEFLENPDLVHPNNEYGNLDEEEVRGNLKEIKSIEQELKNSWMNDKEKRLVKMVLDDSKKKNEFWRPILHIIMQVTQKKKPKWLGGIKKQTRIYMENRTSLLFMLYLRKSLQELNQKTYQMMSVVSMMD